MNNYAQMSVARFRSHLNQLNKIFIDLTLLYLRIRHTSITDLAPIIKSSVGTASNQNFDKFGGQFHSIWILYIPLPDLFGEMLATHIEDAM